MLRQQSFRAPANSHTHAADSNVFVFSSVLLASSCVILAQWPRVLSWARVDDPSREIVRDVTGEQVPLYSANLFGPCNPTEEFAAALPPGIIFGSIFDNRLPSFKEQACAQMKAS